MIDPFGYSDMFAQRTYENLIPDSVKERLAQHNRVIVGELMSHAEGNMRLMHDAIISLVDVHKVAQGVTSLSNNKVDAIKAKYQEMLDYRNQGIEMLKGSSSRLASMQILAHWSSYFHYDEGTEIHGMLQGTGDKKLQGPDYIVEAMIEDKKGFRAIIIRPKEIVLDRSGHLLYPPMVLIQGTVFSNPHDIKDDLRKMLGAEGMRENEEKIKKKMVECQEKVVKQSKSEGKELKRDQVKFDMAGHSLGGNRVQRLAAFCPDLTGTVFTFQSPGAGHDGIVESFQTYRDLVLKQNPEAIPGVDFPVVVHVRNKGDIVTKVGGKFLPADAIFEIRQKGQGLKKSKVHSKISLHDSSGEFEVVPLDKGIVDRSSKWETWRKRLGGVVAWLVGVFIPNNQAIQADQREFLKNWHKGNEKSEEA